MHVIDFAPGVRPAGDLDQRRRRARFRVVGVESGAGTHMTRDALGQRLQLRYHMPTQPGHHGAVDLHALAGVDVGLAVQRKMIAIFRDDHMREETQARTVPVKIFT